MSHIIFAFSRNSLIKHADISFNKNYCNFMAKRILTLDAWISRKCENHVTYQYGSFEVEKLFGIVIVLQ